MSANDQVADHLAVNALYSRYCFAIDASDADAFTDCFTEDGVFEVSGRGEFAGHEAMAGMIQATAEDRPRHMYLNPWIKRLEGDEAEGTAYFLIIDRATGENTAYGHYEDDVVRDSDGTWRWKRRRVVFEWTSPAYAARGRAAVAET